MTVAVDLGTLTTDEGCAQAMIAETRARWDAGFDAMFNRVRQAEGLIAAHRLHAARVLAAATRGLTLRTQQRTPITRFARTSVRAARRHAASTTRRSSSSSGDDGPEPSPACSRRTLSTPTRIGGVR
jgi:hypothetical protein